MQEGGKRLRNVVRKLIPWIKEGMTTNTVDKEAEKLITEQGGKPSFKRVKNYYWTTCLPINEQVVHTPPSERVLKNGDVLTIDIGMYFKGFHTDFADTIIIGAANQEVKHFLEVGKRTLEKAIDHVQTGVTLNTISGVIEDEINRNGYKIIKELTGHGIGRDLHEDPYVFGFRQKTKEGSIVVCEGLAIAIEIIYSKSTENIIYEKDNDWSIATGDGSLSACFEHTVAITHKGTIVLT